MLRYALPALLLLTACPNQTVEEDAGEPIDTGRIIPDTGVVDTGVVEMDAGFMDAEPPDMGFEDAGPPDGGERVIDIRVAYSATAEMPLLAELFITESSTTRHKVTPLLAGGPPTDSKGEPFISGLANFQWTNDGEAIVYSAHQDTFDLYEIYLAPDPGNQQTNKLSVEGSLGRARFWTPSPTTDWITFAQAVNDANTFNYAVRTTSGAQPIQISFGSGGIPHWSPVRAHVVFQDILVSADDRDLWLANLEVTPPTFTRVNAGANLGFGQSVAWAPDGLQLVYSADETALRLFEPWRVSVAVDGTLGARERLTAAFPVNADFLGQDVVQYSPDGARLAFLADTTTDNVIDLFVVDPTLPAPVATTQLTSAFPAGAGGVNGFTWSSDGSRILYRADHDTAGSDELYITDANAASGVKVNVPLMAGETLAHQRFIRNDSMVLYSVDDGSERRVFIVDVSTTPFGAPIDLGSVPRFFPFALFQVSPSGDFMIHPGGTAAESTLIISDLTGTPTVTAELATFEENFSFRPKWCWSEDDELAIIGPDGHLYLVEDFATGAVFQVSGPLVADGRVVECAFPPTVTTK